MKNIALWSIAKSKRNTAIKILGCVIVVSGLNYFVYNTINYDLHATEYSNHDYYQKALIEGNEEEEISFEYRIDYPEYLANYSLFKNMPSVKYYNSLQNPGSSRFAEAVGIGEDLQDTILLSPEEGNEYTDALLSVKYYYDYDGKASVPQGFVYKQTENEVNIYENTNYIPMGFVFEDYCLENQLEELLPEEKAKVMLNALVIRDEDENIVSKLLEKETDLENVGDLETAVSERKETVCSYFKGTSSGFNAEITLEKENIVFFSVPCDDGWEITVNGEPAEIVEVNYGLLGVLCDEGNNIITADYHTQGVEYGIICTAICLIAWGIMEIFLKRR